VLKALAFTIGYLTHWKTGSQHQSLFSKNLGFFHKFCWNVTANICPNSLVSFWHRFHVQILGKRCFLHSCSVLLQSSKQLTEDHFSLVTNFDQLRYWTDGYVICTFFPSSWNCLTHTHTCMHKKSAQLVLLPELSVNIFKMSVACFPNFTKNAKMQC
jgi:hypothetical protein